MIKLFISYAHEDSKHKEGFEQKITSLNLFDTPIEPVSDRKMRGGEVIPEWVDQALREADLGVLLLSDHFLQSAWCKHEMKGLFSRLASGRVIPIEVGPCQWQDVPDLLSIKVVRPQTSFAEDPERAWMEIAREIRAVVREIAFSPALRSEGPGPRGEPEAQLEEAILVGGGQFTPLLGPGVCQVEAGERTRRHLRSRLDWLLESLDADAAREYATSVVSSNFPAALTAPADPATHPAESWMRALVDFQTSLVAVGVEATRQLASELSRTTLAIPDLQTFSLPLASLQPESTLRDLFLEATDKAAALSRHASLAAGRSEQLGLGARGILQQLGTLVWWLFASEIRSRDCDSKVRKWKEGHRHLLKEIRKHFRLEEDELPGVPTLALTQLEWLSNLLWHTLRFQAPTFPRPQDLAFQLSVCVVQFTSPRREHVGTLAALESDLVSRIKGWQESYWSQADDPPHQGFLNAIAKALCRPNGRDRSPTPRAGGLSTSKAALAVRVSTFPLAVTTNLDGELENVLRGREGGFHVLFPVYAGNERREDWVLTDETSAGYDTYTDSYLLRQRSLEGYRERFRGPLIVKLHGSPLIPLEKLTIFDGDFGNRKEIHSLHLEHRLILSDYDFLESLTFEAKTWPAGLREMLLRGERTLCFLGYPVGDLNSRLRLFDQTRDIRTGRVFVVDHPEDPTYIGLLNMMGVQPVDWTVQEIAELIHDRCD